MHPVLNVSGYRFATVERPEAWRDEILERARAARLLGTVLLATEGLNLVLAGAPGALREFLRWLASRPPWTGLEVKESWSATPPFGKLRVKVKAEIIRMNAPAVRPQAGRAPAVDARTLARWLDTGHDDAGRPVVMLDTRNAFEVDRGRFRDALDWRLGRFSDFPERLAAHAGALEGRTVVTYCTGGIRCEKAALAMADAGVANVLQLEGGILKYVEDTGGRHFLGDCFVFDQRVALDATLSAVPA